MLSANNSQIIHKKKNVLQARCLVDYFAIKERLGTKKTNWKQVAKILQPPKPRNSSYKVWRNKDVQFGGTEGLLLTRVIIDWHTRYKGL
jgi:hypothetical protein